MAANNGDDDVVGDYGGDIEAQLEQMRANTIETLRKFYAVDGGDAPEQEAAGTQTRVTTPPQQQSLRVVAPGQPVSVFVGENGRGLLNDAARLLAGRQNRNNTDDGITYTAEEHGDPSLPNKWAVVGRKVALQADDEAASNDGGDPDAATTIAPNNPAGLGIIANALRQNNESPGIAHALGNALGNSVAEMNWGGAIGLSYDDYRATGSDLAADVEAINAANQVDHSAFEAGSIDSILRRQGISDGSEYAMPGDFMARRRDVERSVMLDVLGEEARASSVRGADLFLTAGPMRGGPARGIGSGGFEMVRNGNWEGALNMAADPFGLLGELPGLQGDLARLNQGQAKSRIDDMRQRMIDAGVKNVPDYSYYISSKGSGIDFQATADNLGRTYEDHVRDQRLRETWGDDYQNVRIGKSQMTVLEFEKKVLDVHLQATDRAYAKAVDMVANGELEVPDGQFARTVGNEIDKLVRFELRGLAAAEGINDSSTSNIWAINRRIKSDFVESYGIPDGRVGSNIYHEPKLARKTGSPPQISKWNAIREGNFLIIRPTELGGPYVIPRATIQPYVPQVVIPGRRI